MHLLFKAYSSLISDKTGREKTKKKQDKAEKTPEELADEFFQEMDVDNDGEVTYEEFRRAAVRNEAILSILSPQPPEWDDKWKLLFLENITENWLLTYIVYNSFF